MPTNTRRRSCPWLRSCVVLGPSTDNRMAEGLFRKWLLGVSHDNPPMQFVYEDDLARVMTMFIKQRLPGVFNVAARTGSLL